MLYFNSFHIGCTRYLRLLQYAMHRRVEQTAVEIDERVVRVGTVHRKMENRTGGPLLEDGTAEAPFNLGSRLTQGCAKLRHTATAL